MRAVRWSVVLAAIPLICIGGLASGQSTAAPAPQQQAAPDSPTTSAQPGTGGGTNTKPGGVETDPAKLGETAKGPVTSADPSYSIGAEDVLAIQVWADPRLSSSVMVRPDGRISMSLIGEFSVMGMTPGQVEKTIVDLLKQKDILKNPQVTVQVTQINSKKYFLQGEVNKTGAYPLVVPTTVLEALVNAGGFRDFANEKKIEVIRGNDRFKFNYKDVIKGKHTEQNIFLKPGDIIIVP